MSQVIEQSALTREIEMAKDRAAGNVSAPWLSALRAAGAEHFHSAGLPTSHDEEWRQTNLALIAKTDWQSPPPDQAHGLTADDLAPFAIADLDAHTLVFVDGRFAPELSDTIGPEAFSGKASGGTVGSLAAAIADQPELVQQHLGRHAKPDAEAFTGLNTAHLADGAFVHVPQGAKLNKPVLLQFVSTDTDQPIVSHPRVLFVVEDEAQGSVIENHVGVAQNLYFTNAVTEVVVGDRAVASHYFIERDSDEAANVSTLQIHQGAESDFTSHTALYGGKLVRNNVNPTLAGENAHSLLNGLYLPDKKRHLDNHMRVHHTHPDGDSRQYYTGVIQDQGSGAFVGRIVVDRPAQRTDAVQSSRALLMSDDAHAHSRPQLEIFADDVKCTHGVTIGELDEQSVFYLKSRGIPEKTARGLLIYAFANEALDRIKIEPIRRLLSEQLLRELKLDGAIGKVIE